MTRATLPPRDAITPDTPLRLSVAAALAFPDGSMTGSGLRREGARGRLVIERVAGKDYTTLANIERMRELCRVEVKVPDSGSGPLAGNTVSSPQMRSGSSSMARNISPQAARPARERAHDHGEWQEYSSRQRRRKSLHLDQGKG
jgi:hypothetical protein